MDVDQLAAACDFLEHYHISHTQDEVTRFRGANADIYVVGNRDPGRRKEFRKLFGKSDSTEHLSGAPLPVEN